MGADFVIPHVGVILNSQDWKKLARRMTKEKVEFIRAPHKRFIDKKYEQQVMFLRDPSGNAIEFKRYKWHEPDGWC